MILRTLLALLLVASATACAKKQPPPAAPASTLPADEPKTESTGSDAPAGGTADDKVMGDPCDGGE